MTNKEKDKWYKSLYGKYVFDKRAADAMGRDVQVMEKSLVNFRPMPPKVDPSLVTVPKIDSSFVIGKSWNYPMLIEALEKANKPKGFSRADVQLVLKYKRMTIAKAEQGLDLKQILLSPENEAHNIIRQWWLENYNPFEILKYMGIDKQLLQFLENYQGEDFPVSELSKDFPAVPDTLVTSQTYKAAILTDAARRNLWYKFT